ncbi:hypothetical protein FB45DRAFT_929027 [Roridomyces roridus]|uniref:Uncharacterized protein n=1 Tax=Roridomyces roridus TaxID=1738132 RepID=A0AAD7FIX2_9AGAR|nr:hypothetical protein FB45DRAFT_929027 [Roridomyces roridus]
MKLPPEPEREIFETAALLYPEMIFKMLLTARRVHARIEPMLYQTITFGDDTWDPDITPAWEGLLVAIKSKPSAFLQKHVRHMMVNMYDTRPTTASFISSELPEILSSCNQVHSLILFNSSPSIIPALESAPNVRRLGVFLRDLFGSRVPPLRVGHPLFASLTHLEVFDDRSDESVPWPWADFGLLPELTHLLIYQIYSSGSIPLLLLASCRKLQVLVDLYSELPLIDVVVEDPRFVLMAMSASEYEAEWRAGTRGGLDLWDRAAGFVGKRRRGEIKPASRSTLLD